MKLRFSIFLLLLMMLSAFACGSKSSDGGQSNDTNNQKNLKIFLSDEKHTGDFANDSNLLGSNGVSRADDFCNNASNKPDNSNYKALLVDGLNRIAVPQTDWVLQASTTYYREDGTTIIGTTNSKSIFEVSIGNSLDNAIDDRSTYPAVWTGIQNVTDFSTSGEHCNQWASASNANMGKLGECNSRGTSAFSSFLSQSCNIQNSIYCVEQP